MQTLRQYLEEKVAAFVIPRAAMPQINDHEKFKEFLDKRGLYYAYHEDFPLTRLTPIQVDIDLGKAAAINTKTMPPIIIDVTGYVLDGHHRMYAALLEFADSVHVLQVDESINKLLVLGNEFMEEGASDE